MRYSITSNLVIYQRIRKFVFSIGKNWFLKKLGILYMSHKFGISEGLEYLYRLFYPENARNESNPNSSLHSSIISWIAGCYICVKFNVFNVIRNDFGHILIRWMALFVRVSYWSQIVQISDKLLKIVSPSAKSYTGKMHCLWCITILGYS